MPRGQWTLVACDGAGQSIADVTGRASGVSLTFTRNGVPECQLSLSHDDSQCAVILTALKNGTGAGVPTLKGYRDAGSGKVLKFNGYLAGISEESGTEVSTATFTFRGPFGRLLGDSGGKGRFLGFASSITADAGTIARTLINATNINSVDSFTGVGLNAAFIEATVARTRQYPVGMNIGQAVIDLTNLINGFDFEVAPTDEGTTLGWFHVYAQQGSDKPSAKFEYGPNTSANCAAMHRQTLPPITRTLVVGSALNGEAEDTVARAKYGDWAYYESASDVTELATLDDKASALLRPDPVKAIDFTPDPAVAPSPFDDYWIGDTVQFYAKRGALEEGPVSVRVNQIRVVIDPDSGYEVAEVPDPVSEPLRARLQTEVA